MTGYGSARGLSGGMRVSVELRSVNNRFLDCSVRLPRLYLFAEEAVKAGVQKAISRGKVDVYVRVDSTDAAQVSVRVNRPLARAYTQAIQELAEVCGASADFAAMDLARVPDVLEIEKQEPDTEAFAKVLNEILDEALSGFDRMRRREGEKLGADIQARLQRIEALTEQLAARSPETVEAYRNKLQERMREILADRSLDEGRILQEAAIFADRVSVHEETTRIRSHLSQLWLLLQEGGPVGRKLDFLLQELGREANTVGAKASDGQMAALVIELKAEIEKIREQIQNIE